MNGCFYFLIVIFWSVQYTCLRLFTSSKQSSRNSQIHRQRRLTNKISPWILMIPLKNAHYFTYFIRNIINSHKYNITNMNSVTEGYILYVWQQQLALHVDQRHSIFARNKSNLLSKYNYVIKDNVFCSWNIKSETSVTLNSCLSYSRRF